MVFLWLLFRKVFLEPWGAAKPAARISSQRKHARGGGFTKTVFSKNAAVPLLPDVIEGGQPRPAWSAWGLQREKVSLSSRQPAAVCRACKSRVSACGERAFTST